MRSPGAIDDVRMRGFRQRAEVAEVLACLREGSRGVAKLPLETVPITAAAGRILGRDLVAPGDVPGFRRAAVDGYAVRGADTFAATPTAPVALRLRGHSRPGAPAAVTVGPGEAVQITTGAPLPMGADAVLQAELTRETTRETTRSPGQVLWVEALGPVAPLRHLGEIGEDIARGRRILAAGRRLRPQDAGVIASLGLGAIEVRRRPRVRLLITGDELVAPGEPCGPYQIVDSNSVTLAGLCARDGADLSPVLRARDREADLRAGLTALTAEGADLLLTCGATSVGSDDWLPLLLGERGELLFHGVAMRPSSPTGIGRLGDGRWVILLPGNPVSCLCAYEFFVGPLLRVLGGHPDPWAWPHRRHHLPLARKIVSKVGRFDFVRVAITRGEGGRLALAPVATSGASLLSSTVVADGVVLVPPELEGYAVGEVVELLAFDPIDLPSQPDPIDRNARGADPG